MDQKGDQKYENAFCTQASLAGWTNCWHANEVQGTLFTETSFKVVCRQFGPDSSALIYKQRRLRVNKTMCHHTLPHQSHHTINCHTTPHTTQQCVSTRQCARPRHCLQYKSYTMIIITTSIIIAIIIIIFNDSLPAWPL